jgi:hypothetical protein
LGTILDRLESEKVISPSRKIDVKSRITYLPAISLKDFLRKEIG